MLQGLTLQRNMRSKIRWFTEFCNSHYVSQFAAFFIDARAKRSTVKSCQIVLLFFGLRLDFDSYANLLIFLSSRAFLSFIGFFYFLLRLLGETSSPLNNLLHSRKRLNKHYGWIPSKPFIFYFFRPKEEKGEKGDEGYFLKGSCQKTVFVKKSVVHLHKLVYLCCFSFSFLL